jgi:hypothetical protein
MRSSDCIASSATCGRPASAPACQPITVEQLRRVWVVRAASYLRHRAGVSTLTASNEPARFGCALSFRIVSFPHCGRRPQRECESHTSRAGLGLYGARCLLRPQAGPLPRLLRVQSPQWHVPVLYRRDAAVRFASVYFKITVHSSSRSLLVPHRSLRSYSFTQCNGTRTVVSDWAYI